MEKNEKQSGMDYGERKCMSCGSIFKPGRASQVTCSKKCWKERKNMIRRASYKRRKDRILQLTAERDNLLIENLELKKRLGILVVEKEEEKPEEKPEPEAVREEKKIFPEQKNETEHSCLACGKKFKPTGPRQKFCCVECREKYRRENA